MSVIFVGVNIAYRGKAISCKNPGLFALDLV